MNPRPRRLRASARLRDLVAETVVPASSLVQPHFVLADDRARQDVATLPGIERMGIEPLLRQVESDLELGIGTVLLFGIPDEKDPEGRAGADPEGVVPRAVAALERRFGEDLVVIADVCLCTYTDHGHCGLLRDGKVDNDSSLRPLAEQAVTLAAAGADLVAPSDMMDGRVAAIRAALDEAGFADRGILSYAAKYASAFYGPFRDAAESAPGHGPKDRKTYQMDSRNVREALREVRLDVAEGADMVMVKPALAYLDVIARVRDAVDVPVAAYLVSGEFAALELMAREGMARKADLVREHFFAVRRAGADVLLTYHAREALREGWL